jgi:hypothetical protein
MKGSQRFAGKGLRALVAAGTLAAIGQGCGDEKPGGPSDGEVQLRGAIHKGPFVIGSNVQVSMLDTSGSPTGTVFNTTTRNDLGEFELKLSKLGLAEISTTGFYFNEVTGVLSKAQITLRALAEFNKSGEQSVYVNAMTQMGHLRAKKLLASDKTLAEAVKQAEAELRAAFGLPERSTLKSGTDMNLLGGDDDTNAYLFALSCVLGQAAVNEAPGSEDARLQELVGAIALDLESDGQLGESLQQTLTQARLKLNPLSCSRNMQKRLGATGSSATLPNILKAVDFDRDGSPDADDTDADGDGVAADADKALLVSTSSSKRYVADSGGNVWAWEEGTGIPRIAARFGASRIPKALATSDFQALALLADGTVWRLAASGDPTQDSRASGVVQLHTRPECSSSGDIVAVKEDGTVWNLKENGTASAQISALSDVTLVAGDPANGGGVAIVKKDGTVWTSRTGPTINLLPVTGLTGVKALVGGGWYCSGIIALKEDGSAWAWNINTTDATPTKIAEGIVSAASDSQTDSDLRLVKSDGTVWRWRKSNGTLTQETGLSNAAAISSRAGLVLLRDGTLLEGQYDSTSEKMVFTPPYLPR